MATVIINGNIVTSRGIISEDIRIVDGKIEDIGSSLAKEQDEIIDAKGCYVMPGAIDVHTHFDCEAGGTVADDFETGTKAAIAGGTTTIIDFAEQVKGGTLREAFEAWNNKAEGRTYTDYGYHMTISDWNEHTIQEMSEMIKEGITSFKLFMVYKDLQLNDGEIYEALIKAKELDALIGVHCENGDLIDKLREIEVSKGNTDVIYHAKSRPAIAEKEAISRLAAIAKLADMWIYIVHLSSKEGYGEVINAKREGIKILAETCPQYLLLNEDCYTPNGNDLFEGAKYVMSPPLRDIKSNEALWNGIKNDIINVVATDHCAFNYEEQKELGKKDFTQIPNGAPGVENRFKLMYSYGVKENRIDMKKLVEVLCESPAKIFGLYPKKGTIQKGSDADIVIFNPNHTSIIESKNQIQNVDYNLYEGFKQHGKFEYVFLRGEMIVKDDKIVTSKPLGKYQRRNKSYIFNDN
ncbi:dihydropyrimidinase [Brassicibacter mesophilus]|uniref:dihydropyrimidinase n=1 Tax=Brassicibacter mesophilus TaxID=745119 RepID=UPI003D20172C